MPAASKFAQSRLAMIASPSRVPRRFRGGESGGPFTLDATTTRHSDSLDSQAAAVYVDGMTFSYGRGTVLHGLSFAVGRGEVVGLLGPNGAGKSTIIKLLAGILAPGPGTIRVAGCALPDQSMEAKKRTGYVPESGGLFESLTGQEFLELMGRLREVPEQSLQLRIGRFLDLFGLAGDRHGRIDSYSKGMRQKLLLSAALLHNPEVVMLDEPLTGLDVNSSLIARDLIAALAGQGKAVLYSSHVLDAVERVCDRALIIHQGRLLADGELASLKESTKKESLEEVFRHLTAAEGAVSDVAVAMEALRL